MNAIWPASRHMAFFSSHLTFFSLSPVKSIGWVGSLSASERCAGHDELQDIMQSPVLSLGLGAFLVAPRTERKRSNAGRGTGTGTGFQVVGRGPLGFGNR